MDKKEKSLDKQIDEAAGQVASAIGQVSTEIASGVRKFFKSLDEKEKAKVVRFCDACGTQVPQDDIRCESCGKGISK
ncbi:MAG: hypothetical protein FWD89_01400 [Firmicutes bacterium]|nr:hypothetical protein [Bacillota bacterium]MCL2770947.1 hypothetical protein [Bacillota bacterium]